MALQRHARICLLRKLHFSAPVLPLNKSQIGTRLVLLRYLFAGF